MDITDTKQRYIDTVACFTTPHDVEGAIRALHAAGFGAKVHLEIVDDGSDDTRFVHVWQPTDVAGDYDDPGAMAAINAFDKKVGDIVSPFGGDDANGAGFSDDLSKLPEEWQIA